MSDAARARILTLAGATTPVKAGPVPGRFDARPGQMDARQMVGRSRVVRLGPQTTRHLPMTYAAGTRLWEASTTLTVRYDAPDGVDDEALERAIQEDARELVRTLTLPSNWAGAFEHITIGVEPARVVDVRGRGGARVARELQIPLRYQFFA